MQDSLTGHYTRVHSFSQSRRVVEMLAADVSVKRCMGVGCNILLQSGYKLSRSSSTYISLSGGLSKVSKGDGGSRIEGNTSTLNAWRPSTFPLQGTTRATGIVSQRSYFIFQNHNSTPILRYFHITTIPPHSILRDL